MTQAKAIVFFGPSGTGKSTLVNRMMKEFPDKFGFSISHTTRKPRPGEADGVHYHYISMEKMKEDVENGKFIESAMYSKNLYGTSKAAVEKVIQSGKICVLDIDVQGVKKIKKSELNPWYVFIEPPSLEELEARLRARNTENEESLAHRLQVAEEEIKYGRTPGNVDLIITNDDLDRAYSKLKEFLTQKVLK